ncbi:MAG TPA: hypothetical protein VH392_07820 [Sphingomicrobium sp.]|jgi:hypothetical protein
MREFEQIDAHEALRQAQECCARIAAVLEETSGEAEQLGDRDMIVRLAAAKAAADRAQDLIARLAGILVTEQSATTSQRSA